MRYKAGRIEVLKHFGIAHNHLSLDISVELPARCRPRMGDISNYHDTANSGQSAFDFTTTGALTTDTSGAHSSSPAARGPRVVSSPARLVWDVLDGVHLKLGFDEVGYETFAATVISRVADPSSKMQVPRIIGELGRVLMHYNTVYNSIRRCIERDYYQHISCKCHAYVRQHRQVTMVLYGVTTLHFATPKEDELRKISMSKKTPR